jgi:hypothetical protein
MSASDHDTQVLEKAKISQVIASWGIWRDSGAWDKLRTTYTPDGTMAVSWFDGPAKDFIDGCVRMFAQESDRINSQHLIGASAIELHGDRAVAETRITILVRLSVHDIESDVTAIARFHDLFLRTGSLWQIKRRVAIFDKDSVRPVDPAAVLRLDETQLRRYPAAYRYCGYVLGAKGMQINPDLPAPNSAALQALYARAQTWLEKGTLG